MNLEPAIKTAYARHQGLNPLSRAQFERACGLMPGGSSRSVIFYEPFPLTMVHGEGAHLRDLDGHQYLDLVSDMTAGIYGHSDPVIRDAIISALTAGISLGAINQFEQLLADEIVRRFESIQLVRFTNSGSEANLMAIEAARAFTQREAILVFEGAYHGGVLVFPAGTSTVNVPYSTFICPYNDAEGAASILEAHGARIAAVLVEPMLGAGGAIPAHSDFLVALRDAANRAGSVLIFDEVMCSRLGYGGLQGQYAVTPDMTTLGKYMGGGLSFGAFGGRQEIMQQFDLRRSNAKVHSGTFNNNVLSMAAGHAGLSKVLTRDAIDGLNARGDRFRERLNDVAVVAGASIHFTGIGSLMNAHFWRQDGSAVSFQESHAKELLFLQMLNEGIYTARRGLIALSLPVNDKELDCYLEVLKSFISKNKRWLVE